MADSTDLSKEFLAELEKVKSLGVETLKALALEFSTLGEKVRLLDSLKKATAILALKEKAKEKKEKTTTAQRLLNVIRANQVMMLHIFDSTEGNASTIIVLVVGSIP